MFAKENTVIFASREANPKSTARQRAATPPQRPGQAAGAQEQLLQRTIGNQALLRLLTQGAATPPQRPGQAAVAQGQVLQRTIDNQALLRLLMPVGGGIQNELCAQAKKPDAARDVTQQERPAQDFSNIPVFPPDDRLAKTTAKPDAQTKHGAVPTHSQPNLQPVASQPQVSLVQRMCACGGGCPCCRDEARIQTKVPIGPLGDRYEQEADHIGTQVMRMPERTVQPQLIDDEDENIVQTKPVASQITPLAQRSAQEGGPHMTGSVATDTAHTIENPSGGRPLSDSVRRYMEPRFGVDFGDVRVHSGSESERLNRSLDSQAFTYGQDIWLGAGESESNLPLLAHELTHVVQQSGSAGMALQRQARGAAAGCGICMNDPGGRVAGDIAHAEVQGAFIAANPDMVAERPVPGIPNSGIDISYERWRSQEHALFIGEIKPLDDAKQQADVGRRQLQDYYREMMLSGQYDEVYRMRNRPPPGPLYFFNSWNPPGCPRQTIIVQLTEPGLYQYHCEPPFSQLVRNPSCHAPWCRPRRDDEPGPFVPPIWVRPGDQPGSSETKGKGGDQPGKGNGEPGKGDRGRRPGRPPGRDQPQQPTFRLPSGPLWDKVFGALIIISGLVAARTLWGKLGALLGLLARALGFTLGLAGGAVAAVAGTLGRTGGAPDVEPVPGSVTMPGRTTGSKTQKPVRTERTAPAKAAPPAEAFKVIENLNLERVAVGNVVPVEFAEQGRKTGEARTGTAILQVTKVLKRQRDTTVEFISLQEREYDSRTGKGHISLGGRKFYTVTHPHVGSSDEPGLIGVVMPNFAVGHQWFWKYLENLANELENAGDKNLANQVRTELQRLKPYLPRMAP